MIYGNDISHHQRKEAVKELVAYGKCKFIITRATIGSHRVDNHISEFIKDIQSSNIKNGHYVANYCKDEKEAIEEANFLCDTIERLNDKVEMPLFFDWEYFSADYIKKKYGIDITSKLLQSMALAFCKRIQERGYKAGIYLNKDYWDRFYGDTFFKKHPEIYVWYARPGYSKPDKPCYLWQYRSDNGRDYGYAGNIDKNILMGEFIGEVEEMKPLSKEPIRMYIGFASTGDIKKLESKIKGLGIETEIKEGYIITGYVSAGDQCYIMTDCNALGVKYEIYTTWNDKNNDKIYRSTSKNNQYFKSADVNDVVGYLPKGDYKIKSSSDEQIGGFDWMKIEVEGSEYYVVVLSDRCEIVRDEDCETIKKENEELKIKLEEVEKEVEKDKVKIKELETKNDKLKKGLISIEKTVKSILEV